MPLTFFYPEYDGKKTSPQAYVKEAIRRQQELNELCRENTAQAQMRQRKKYDEKILQAKPYEVGQYVWVFQNVIPPKGRKKLLKKWRGPFMITEVHQQGRFYRLSTGRAAHYENLKPHVPSPEDWCIPKDMEGLEYLLVEPACEVNERGTREKNDGNENLSFDDNEKKKRTLKQNLLWKKTGTIRSKVRCRSGQNQTYQYQRGQGVAIANGQA